MTSDISHCRYSHMRSMASSAMYSFFDIRASVLVLMPTASRSCVFVMFLWTSSVNSGVNEIICMRTPLFSLFCYASFLAIGIGNGIYIDIVYVKLYNVYRALYNVYRAL